MDSSVSARNRRRLARERLLRFWLTPPDFVCPVCDYAGPFLDVRNRDIGRRLYGQCPRCNTRERHRLLRLVIADLARRSDLSGLRALHFSPETVLSPWLRGLFSSYETSDFARRSCDHAYDLTAIDLPAGAVDVVIACHVLEHVPAEEAALKEIARILKPGGMALLPVPINAEQTIEYGGAFECGGHVRAPGPDYFDRLRRHFGRVELYSAANYSPRYQLSLIQPRTCWPTVRAPHLRPMPGLVFPEILPIAIKSAA
jgi:SAM-dependent methyltransferase